LAFVGLLNLFDVLIFEDISALVRPVCSTNEAKSEILFDNKTDGVLNSSNFPLPRTFKIQKTI
jgi:hypothetical protein